jgi:hypothetical protein
MNKRYFLTIGFAVLVLLCSFTTLYALEGQFEINATVATTDAIAPSVPTGLIATAVSTTQIDLSWTVSTDNVAVTGYRIFRDNAFVTTSATTNYSDTGLTPSTTYNYTVSAVDAATNESARSATSSATTFTPSAGGNGGQFIKPLIYDVVVTPTQTGAVISWKTLPATLGNLSWGLTTSNELGTSGGVLYSTTHSVSLAGLLAGTTHFFSIEAISGYGAKAVLENQTFTTLSIPEGNINPTNFTATAREKDILLSWKNPTDQTFDEVRLVRSKSFFPTDPNDGEVIYEGRNESLVDSDVSLGVTYYYALFAKDTNNKFSSGSLAKARIKIPGEPEIPPKDVFDSLPTALNVHPLIQALTFLDFDFIQEGKKIATIKVGETVTIKGDKNLTVSLDYRKVPEVLKSIVITLTHPTDKEKTFSFLLRVNDEKTVYSATIGPLGDSGIYGVKISIVDYKNQGLKKIVGNLLALAGVSLGDEQNIFRIIIKIITENKVNLLLLVIISLVFLKSVKVVIEKKKNKKHSLELKSKEDEPNTPNINA